MESILLFTLLVKYQNVCGIIIIIIYEPIIYMYVEVSKCVYELLSFIL